MGTHNENLSLKFKIRGSNMHIFLIQQHEVLTRAYLHSATRG